MEKNFLHLFVMKNNKQSWKKKKRKTLYSHFSNLQLTYKNIFFFFLFCLGKNIFNNNKIIINNDTNKHTQSID